MTETTSNAGAPKRPRRTQAERRAATRAALLDATIECIIEDGYANVTTTRVVERAGVSRGAQVHHFHTKADLVSEAVSHLTDLRMAELRREAARLPHGPDRTTAGLDLLWKVYIDPLFLAALDLFVAARTDAELREGLVAVETRLIAETYEVCREIFAPHADSPNFDASLSVALTSIQGLALLNSVLTPSRRMAQRSWKATRDRLVLLFEAP